MKPSFYDYECTVCGREFSTETESAEAACPDCGAEDVEQFAKTHVGGIGGGVG